ncbi:MAG TPA: hypothetical protein VJN93_13250 [Candidatus Acidoferrum sp.]|nr:hypothetical protein [Candidatus Acidoferrum sp.]
MPEWGAFLLYFLNLIRLLYLSFLRVNEMIQILRETHDTPESVAQLLRRAGGLNRFGEPTYRAIWGWNRLAWIGGKFEDRNAAGELLREVIELRLEPKYPAVNRWHIERWVPPESYGSPRAWYAQTIERQNGVSIPALGPYPSRGEYEHCFTLETPHGKFIQLTLTVAEHVARAIEFSRHLPAAARKRSIYERELRDGQAYESWAYDRLDDAVPAFHKQPFVPVK